MQINENIQIHEIQSYRAKLEQLEALVRRRDEIKASIAQIDATLLSILGAELYHKFHTSQKTKAKATRTRNSSPMSERLKAVFDAHPQGATIQQIATGLGVTRVTAATYVYTTAKHLVKKSHNETGTSVWFFNN